MVISPVARSGGAGHWSNWPTSYAYPALGDRERQVKAPQEGRATVVLPAVATIAATGVATIATDPPGASGTDAVAACRPRLSIATDCQSIAEAANRGEPTGPAIAAVAAFGLAALATLAALVIRADRDGQECPVAAPIGLGGRLLNAQRQCTQRNTEAQCQCEP